MNPSLDPVEQARRRAWQYWYVDGLAEIAFGEILLVLSAYFYAQAILPEESPLQGLLDIGLIAFLLGNGLLVRWLVRAAKERITYPRTGYVTYPKATRRQRLMAVLLTMVMSFLVAGLVARLLAAAPASLAWMPAISGLILAGVLLLLGYRFALTRFYLLSLVSLLAGAGLALGGIGDLLGTAIFYALIGVALLLSGGLTLWTYLRRTRPPADVAPE